MNEKQDSPAPADQSASGHSRSGVDRRSLLKNTVAGAVGLLVTRASSAKARPISSRTDRLQSGVTPLKQQAIADYQTSMEPYGGSLSCPIEQLLHAPKNQAPYQFDVAVIGSGYGASICAARLAGRLREGRRLCVIERGKEWTPGTFGDTLRVVRGESRFELQGNKRNSVTNPVGLVNLVQNDEVNVLTGSGLGGGSLINANVALRPEPEVFNIPQWPAALRDRAVLDPYYDLAAFELGVQTTPWDATPKMRAQRLAAENLVQLGAVYQPADLSITHDCSLLDESNRNRQGVIQRPCVNCGCCTAGCNIGAKNTLAMNYLPMARRNGAEIFTQTEVVTIQKMDGYYRIYVKHYIPKADGYDTVYGMVTARIVILGAGSLGSTEILLRSWAAGFEFSKKLGWNWTGNGDALGWVLRSEQPTNIGGFGAFPHAGAPVGPTIQTNITFPDRPNFRDRVLIQDGSVARSYVNAAGLLMQDPELQSTMALLGMGHDGANGRIVLRDGGHAQVKWPGLKESAYRKYIRAHFEQVAKAHGGKYKYLKIFGIR